MIILDDDEEQLPKLATPPPVHTIVRFPRSSSPSLPDYETSQKLHRLEQWKRKILTRPWRWAIYGLITYFVITVAIGVPILVVKTRHHGTTYKNPSLLYPSPAANSSFQGLNLGVGPLCVQDATACNTWNYTDRPSGGLYQAQLQYSVPVTDTVFLQSNITFPNNITAPPVTGALSVGMSSDPTAVNATIKVTMSYSNQSIRTNTNVCLMNIPRANGLYIYVPNDVGTLDELRINVSVLLPKGNGTSPLYVDNFVTTLPFFTQNFGNLGPQVMFGSIALGGRQSNVTVKSLQAEEIYIRSAAVQMSSVQSSDDDDDDPDDSDFS